MEAGIVLQFFGTVDFKYLETLLRSFCNTNGHNLKAERHAVLETFKTSTGFSDIKL